MLKLDAITLKNLDAKGNQATWSAEGDVLPVTIPIPGWSVGRLTNCSTDPDER
ncbi:DUF1202 family protein [Escherichia coli]